MSEEQGETARRAGERREDDDRRKEQQGYAGAERRKNECREGDRRTGKDRRAR